MFSSLSRADYKASSYPRALHPLPVVCSGRAGNAAVGDPGSQLDLNCPGMEVHPNPQTQQTDQVLEGKSQARKSIFWAPC